MRPNADSGVSAMGAGLVAVTVWLAGCAAPPPPPPPLPAPVPAPANLELPFEQAVAQAADALIGQASALPGFQMKKPRPGVALDPMLDATSGQQTVATQSMERRVRGRMADGLPDADLLPLASSELAKANYVLTGTLTRGFANRPKDSILLNLALTDLASGNVVAQSWALTRDVGLDNTPLPYYADSPVLVKDRMVEGYITTSATGAGKRADPYYVERMAVAAAINDATASYNAERYQDALAQYRAAGGGAGGEQLRVLNGIYLASVKVGRPAESELAFGKVVAYGIANNQLGVKFLFNPGGTVFWSDPKVSGPYPMWLRRIARESTAAKACMTIVGHTSHTGSEAYNDTLSWQRAAFIRQRLVAVSAVLAARTKAVGVGYRENLVGSGTDNAVDALDRRVEFKIVPCP